MLAAVKQWGNSYAVRLTSRDLRRLGVQLGDQVEVTVRPLSHHPTGASSLPVFHSGLHDASQRHDDYLYGEP